jgi:MOSC domain-containing protein YiiM
VEGDRWSRGSDSARDSQVTLMREDVARIFANGQPLSLFGDNLLVEMDLAEENLPAGTRLRIGTVLCEVTAKPHTGCGKFERRVGSAARAVTAAPEWVNAHLRGIHVRVLEPGDVSPGDAVCVLSRPG